MTEMVHAPHLSDAHEKAWRTEGCRDIIFTSHDDGRVTVDGGPQVIMCSAEVVDQMRHAVNEGTHVRGDLLRIKVSNASMDYELRRLSCGCWLGTRVS